MNYINLVYIIHIPLQTHLPQFIEAVPHFNELKLKFSNIGQPIDLKPRQFFENAAKCRFQKIFPAPIKASIGCKE